jgi:hypothetical protein
MIRALRVSCLLWAPLIGLGCTGAVGPELHDPGLPGPAAGGPRPGGGGSPGGAPGPGNPGGAPPGPGQQPPPGPAPVMPPGPGALSDLMSVPAPAPLRRLTKAEYDNTLRDLLGVTASVSKATPVGDDAESHDSGFVRGGAITGADDVRNVMGASSTVGDGLGAKLATLLPCNPIPTAAADQEACVTKFIPAFGKRAYRRPLTTAEVDIARKLYTTQRGPEVGATFEQAVSVLVAAFIQAPQFLYHWELGGNAPTRDGNLIKYNPWELASRLSYLFWGTMPDDKLFAAAEANMLNTPDQIAAQARRMLGDERAKQGLHDFYIQWLEVGMLPQVPKDDEIKSFSPAVAEAMLAETREFINSVFMGPGATGSLQTLLTSTNTTVDANLAKIYGGTVTGAGAKPLMLNPAQRAGILTQLAFLTAHADTGDSHPIKRGDGFLRRLLCIDLQVPATLMIPPVADPVPGGATTRQRFEMHLAPQCAGCHNMIDPIGFAFESYDTVGAFRTQDQGKPVVTTGQVNLPSGTTLTFKNAVELITQLASSNEAQDCFTQQWMRYLLGRRVADGEAPSVAVLRDAFKTGKHDFRELLVAMTKSRVFTHRSPSPGEVTQ